VTEHELFSAYRHLGHWEAECACGEMVVSEQGDEAAVTSALNIHYESTVHAQWRVWQDAVRALQRPTRRKCPCAEHSS
jgi:hypothetical protein